MKWANCLVKRWDDNRTDINCKFEMFTLPKEQKDEIDKIINSDSSWEEKAEKIRRVYESYLFENVKDQNGNNPFLEYAAELKDLVEIQMLKVWKIQKNHLDLYCKIRELTFAL